MDIYSYLKKDHRKVSALMEQVLAAKSAARRKEIFREIHRELLLHAKTEEATFYAALESDTKTEEWIEEATEEHDEITRYLEKLSRMSAAGEKWLEVFGEFKHAVEHHVNEEEGRIFQKAEDVLSDEEAENLAEEMDRLKHEYVKEAA